MSSLLTNLNQISSQSKKESEISPELIPTLKMTNPTKEKAKISVDTELRTETSNNNIELKLIRKFKLSKDVKKTFDCSYELDDRIKLFLSDYNKEFRQDTEFSILSFQLFCQTALEEYLTNRGY